MLETLEGRPLKHSFWKMVLWIVKVRNKGVEHTVSFDFGSVTSRGFLEEHWHPGVAGECRRTESRGSNSREVGKK